MLPGIWQTITESQFPWEREALEFVRSRFPTREPYRAWSNFEFIADDGSINEVDLLVLTPVGFFLVEIKSRPGIIRGDAGTWIWQHDGKLFTDDNPILAADRKAKKLKSLLERQKAIKKFKGRIPFLDPLIFCSGPDQQNQLTGTAAYRVCLRDRDAAAERPARPGIMAAIEHRDCPGLEKSVKCHVDRPTAKAISQAMDQAGIRPSKRSRKVSDFVLSQLLLEGPGFQDWQATHVKLEDVKRRVRVYLVRTGASAEDRQIIERAALREFHLLETLQHPNILRTHGFTEHELGPALIFEHFPKCIRLDHYMAQVGQRLTPEQRIELLRQIAEVVRFAHDKRVVHRALSPQSILVVDPGADRPQIKVFNWQVGYRAASSSTGASRGQITGTIHVEQLVDDASTAYMAPEALVDRDNTGEHLDVFSLGAIAYYLFSGKPPAANALELSEKLRETKGLQISSVVNGAGEHLQDIIQESTHPDVSLRLESARFFLEYLDEVQKELVEPEHDIVEDPARAQMGDRLPGGLVVQKRLGSGACSVALLVHRDDQELVLKVATTTEHNERLRGEGEVLQKLRHQHIVEVLETLEISDRVCLLMHRAGTETLGDRLAKEGRLLVDLLQRFGEDLLQVAVFLEEQGIPHRDIKPSNIGVGKVGRGDKLHLVLFDFSLSRTPAENIRAGTTGYLEPFLSLRNPPRWDLHAERYATAVTLYELATGNPPKWGDGKSDPALLDCEATIDAEVFDASIRDQLTAFFTKALRRNPAERFDNAEEMLRAWRNCFEGVVQPKFTEQEDWEELKKLLQTATLDTAVSELGLGTRAVNALDRVNVLNVRDLLTFPARRLSRLRGVGNKTRREINAAVKILRQRLGTPEKTKPTTQLGAETETALVEAGVASVDMIVKRVTRTNPRARSDTEKRFLMAFLGLDADLKTVWPTQAEVADHIGVTRGRIGQLVTAAQQRWRRDAIVTSLRNDMADILARGGNIMAVEEMAAAVILARGSVEDDPVRSQMAMAITRAAMEVERSMADPRWVLRRDHERSLVAASQALADYAVRLGRDADDLAVEDPLAPPVRVLEKLRAVPLPSGLEPLSDTRLVRVAVLASRNGAVSSRQEIYPRGMDGLRALKLSQGALLGASQLSVEEVRQRVSGRYPEAAPLPDRPELDDLLKTAGFVDFEWDETAGRGGAYRSRAKDYLTTSTPSTPLHRHPTRPGPPSAEITPEEAQARQFEERLRRAISDPAFIAMTVEPRGYFLARDELCRRFPIEPVDVEAAFVAALRNEVTSVGAKWDRVLAADATPGSDDWNKLMVLVRRAVPKVEAAIAGELKTVLMLFPGLLARYDQMDVLARVREKIGRPGGIAGLWMLIPADAQSALPVIDGKPVPVIGPAEWARVPEKWFTNAHRSDGNRQSATE